MGSLLSGIFNAVMVMAQEEAPKMAFAFVVSSLFSCIAKSLKGAFTKAVDEVIVHQESHDLDDDVDSPLVLLSFEKARRERDLDCAFSVYGRFDDYSPKMSA